MNLNWKATGEFQTIETEHWQCAISPREPERGALIRTAGASSDSAPWARVFSLPALLGQSLLEAETFTRSGDLHLRYGATQELPTSVDLVWRLLDPRDWLEGAWAEELAEVLLLESVISFQTDLLDAPPIREVHSYVPAGGLRMLPPPRPARPGEIDPPPSLNARLSAQGGKLWLTVVYPSDLRWMAASRQAEQEELEIRLRADNLEKGVIRRLRCLFACGPESLELKFQRLPERFADSNLPLSF